MVETTATVTVVMDIETARELKRVLDRPGEFATEDLPDEVESLLVQLP